MKFAKFSLLASAIGFAGFGLALFIAPNLMESAGLSVIDPAGRIEIRAFYGGIELGLAMFFLIALKKDWILPGLSVQIETNGFIVIARIVSLFMENFQANSTIYWSLAAELSLLTLGVVAIRLYKRKQKEK
ncbi:MAG: hypothetical protein DRP93_04765 [Candidatus Neomarinimicrobiota bacterium]|nr:MAG: hypothetical protein DRP93_04765 [Candidatus Neomarinimicrobiota bacterium]